MVGPIGKTSPTPGTPAPVEVTTTLSTENIIRKASRSQIEVPMSHLGAYMSHQEILWNKTAAFFAAGSLLFYSKEFPGGLYEPPGNSLE
eukprot:scaffold61182_cov45-Phaeocystis_antarctica.AAC.2